FAPNTIPQAVLDVARPSLIYPQRVVEDLRSLLGELVKYFLAQMQNNSDGFSVHRLIQEITINNFSSTQAAANPGGLRSVLWHLRWRRRTPKVQMGDGLSQRRLLLETIDWLDAAFDGNYMDPDCWSRLAPLSIHVEAALNHALEDGIEPSLAMSGLM